MISVVELLIFSSSGSVFSLLFKKKNYEGEVVCQLFVLYVISTPCALAGRHWRPSRAFSFTCAPSKGTGNLPTSTRCTASAACPRVSRGCARSTEGRSCCSAPSRRYVVGWLDSTTVGGLFCGKQEVRFVCLERRVRARTPVSGRSCKFKFVCVLFCGFYTLKTLSSVGLVRMSIEGLELHHCRGALTPPFPMSPLLILGSPFVGSS